MKPLDLKEWAESLIRAGEHVDYAREVLDLLGEAGSITGYYALREDLERITESKPTGEHWRLIECIEDRYRLLDELAEQVEAVMPGKGLAIGLETLIAEWEDMRTELDALKAPEYDL